MWIERTLGKRLLQVAGSRPATLLTGPRQTGKSSLLDRLFPKATRITLDVVSQARAAEENPQRFLRGLPAGHDGNLQN
jgi:predicted AAA+ superfamily ATPase